MSLSFHDGTHTFGPVPGGRALNPSDSLDITRQAVAHLHCQVRTVFVFHEAELHVHVAPSDEVWASQHTKVHVHTPCTVWANGYAEVFVYAEGTLVIAEQSAKVHVLTPSKKGVRVRAYGESEVYAESSVDIALNYRALQHTPDGRTIGHRPLYKSQVHVEHY